MPRKPRLLVDHGCYHVIARGNNRHPVFATNDDFCYFLDLIKRSKKHFPSKLYHYCLMSNHIHLHLEIFKGEDLPKFMQAILQGYGRWYQKKVHYIGHLWQGRYKSPFIAKESYFLEVGRYIERNPVRAGIVKDTKDYPWSSYHHYAYGQMDILVDEDPYHEQLGWDSPTRQEMYRRFVAIESPYEKQLDQEFLEAPF